jgi:hypothetical protein
MWRWNGGFRQRHRATLDGLDAPFISYRAEDEKP